MKFAGSDEHQRRPNGSQNTTEDAATIGKNILEQIGEGIKTLKGAGGAYRIRSTGWKRWERSRQLVPIRNSPWKFLYRGVGSGALLAIENNKSLFCFMSQVRPCFNERRVRFNKQQDEDNAASHNAALWYAEETNLFVMGRRALRYEERRSHRMKTLALVLAFPEFSFKDEIAPDGTSKVMHLVDSNVKIVSSDVSFHSHLNAAFGKQARERQQFLQQEDDLKISKLTNVQPGYLILNIRMSIISIESNELFSTSRRFVSHLPALSSPALSQEQIYTVQTPLDISYTPKCRLPSCLTQSRHTRVAITELRPAQHHPEIARSTVVVNTTY
ncbi:hypothetical protein WN51_05489 [Melipona quadrifasciata]|uniref:Uncharacterized protein n=1 Tax=Melipona quadrifasciata TaxID=166423 RepID=A0A0N0BKI8_9HYME|nr:hypothetical protein WN51_05489 [Melipona quadrifasciata]